MYNKEGVMHQKRQISDCCKKKLRLKALQMNLYVFLRFAMCHGSFPRDACHSFPLFPLMFFKNLSLPFSP